MISIEEIISFSLQNRQVLDHLGEALRSDLVVANPFYRTITTFADDFNVERGKLPGIGDWALWVSNLPELQQKPVRDALGQLLQAKDFSEYDPTFFADQVLESLKTGASRVARARINEIQDISPETFRTFADKIEAISAGSIKGLVNLRDVDIWSTPPRDTEVIPTGYNKLDRALRGWGPELWMVLADSGMGKSMTLQNFAGILMRRGKKVLHLTLELGLRPLIHRYYRAISQVDRAGWEGAPEEFKARLKHWFKFAQGEVFLLEYPAYSIDPIMLKRLVDRIIRTHGIDVLVLDYLDLLSVPTKMRKGSSYEDLGTITVLVRTICQEYKIPVLTATQAVRQPKDVSRLTMKDMGDSYNKVRAADGILSLVQTPEEAEMHQGRIGVVKARDASGDIEQPVYINRELALILDLDSPTTIALMDKLGHLPGQQLENILA